MTVSATNQGLKPGVVTSSNRPANPFDGQVIYMTDVDQTAVWDGSSWVGIERSRDRNVVINGAMQVAQRGTSTASITTNGYYTADRFTAILTTCGTWTQSVEADAPTGSGFRNSLKMLCTTADASPTGLDQVRIDHIFEGQNVQQFAKGTASAKPFSLSFWVKANVTGTYIATLVDNDNVRVCSASYSIDASATWEKKTITFPADTTGAFDNDNNASFRIVWWLAAGTDYTSGTLQTTWASNVNANRAVGQTNLAAATNNYWQITGVQLEAGSVATPFEFEDYGTTLRKCQRYYYRQTPNSAFGAYGLIAFVNSTSADFILANRGMRTDVVILEYANIGVVRPGINNYSVTTMYIAHSGIDTSYLTMGGFTSGASQGDAGLLVNNNNAAGYIAVSAEL